MAKKQSLSYGPNTGLIAGEAQVAASEAGLSNTVGAFAQGFGTVFGAFQKQEEERNARMEAYNSQVPSVAQKNFIQDAGNKQLVTAFLNKKRDEYSKLAKVFDKTKDRDVKDKMEAIKFSLVNLNDQIKVFNEDKLEYRTAFDENQLASGESFEKDFFTNIFTNNGSFSINDNGDIGFSTGGVKNKSKLYKDHASKWNVNNNIDETNILKNYSTQYRLGGQGKAFNKEMVRRSLLNSFKQTGNNALQVLVTTDLTSDNSSLSFKEQFASGELAEKHPEIYAGFTKNENGTYDTEWMFESKNNSLLKNKVTDYFTKVIEDGHSQGRTDNYVDEAAIAAEKARLLALEKMGVVSSLGKTTHANMFEGGNNTYISETELETINNIGASMAKRSKITGPDGAYTWDDTKKSYFLADGSVVPNKATMLSWLFKDQKINPTFKESDFFKSIPEWDGSKWVKEDNGDGGGDGDGDGGKKSKATTIKNDVVKQVKLPWGMGMSNIVASDVKKINGTWHVSEKVGYSGEIKWVKATQKQIDKINKSYK